MESARLKNLRDSIDTSSILFNLAIFIFSFHPTYTHTTYTAKRVGKRERERERDKRKGDGKSERIGRVHSTRTYAFRVERKQVHVFIPLRFGSSVCRPAPRLVFFSASSSRACYVDRDPCLFTRGLIGA